MKQLPIKAIITLALLNTTLTTSEEDGLMSLSFNSAAAIETITVTGSYCGDEEDEWDINDQIEQDMIDLQEEMNADMLAELQAEIDQALDDALAEDVYEPTREECKTTNSAAQKSCTANAKVAFSTALDNVCFGKGTVTGSVKISANGIITEVSGGIEISYNNYEQCKDSKEAQRDGEIAVCEAIEENANQWCPAQ